MRLIIALLVFSSLSPGSTIQELLAKYEGWGISNSLTHRLHNPGALSYAGQKGATRGPGGYARFAKDEDGWRALDVDLQAKVKKHHVQTLRELLRFWDSKRYLRPISRELGIPPDAKLDWILIPDGKYGWRINFAVHDR